MTSRRDRSSRIAASLGRVRIGTQMSVRYSAKIPVKASGATPTDRVGLRLQSESAPKNVGTSGESVLPLRMADDSHWLRLAREPES